MTRHTDARRPLQVGTLRQNQLSHTYGVGAMADLPNLSVITLGLDFWNLDAAKPVPEERLLAAVRAKLGSQVKDLYLPPYKPEKNGHGNEETGVGVPVGLFPSFLRCTACGLLGRPNGANFQLKSNSYNPDQTRYVHLCTRGNKPQLAVPARFVLACDNGHLDDFPWQYFVHRREQPEGVHALTLRESGTTGEASDVYVSCTDAECAPARQMSEAFGEAAQGNLPKCRGRHPHLKSFESCDRPVRTLALGATNSWFPLRLSSITLPQDEDSLDQLVAEYSGQLQLLLHLPDEETAKRHMSALSCWSSLEEYGEDAVLEALNRHARQEEASQPATSPTNLQAPEWEKLTADAAIEDPDFTTRPEPVPPVAQPWLRRVVLVPRLRQVTALYGFTRIDAPEWEVQQTPNERSAPLAKAAPTWLPCSEMRGEGVFLQFDEERIREWENRSETLDRANALLIPGYRKWCAQRDIPDDDWPGLRYVLLHTFSHALIRQLALESGYSASGITERIYADRGNPSMAGILLYTAAPDSEGTLGGLVSLGESDRLGHFIERALESAKLCSSDPLCSEHDPRTHGRLYGSACHACLFASETSCERGNHYLDRALLVDTIGVTGTGLLSG